ncbi:YscB family type III secretion system chaperone, partial [Vibrio agarivorans]
MFEQLMRTLSKSLKMESFLPLSDGSYSLEVDNLVVAIQQHSNWILWETSLSFQFSEQYDYREEASIKKCMLHTMRKLRSSPSTLTINKDKQ